MALTPEKIAALNQATGMNVPLDAQPGIVPVQSRATQIRELAQQVKPTETYKGSAGQTIDPTNKGEFSNTGSRIKDVMDSGKEQIASIAEKTATGQISKGEGFLQGAGAIAKTTLGTVFSLPVLHGFTKHVSNGVEKSDELVKYAADKVYEALPEDFKKEHALKPQDKLSPEEQQRYIDNTNAVLDLVNLGMTAVGGAEALSKVNAGVPGAVDAITKSYETAKSLGTKTLEGAKEVTGKVTDLVKPKIETAFKGKTQEQILSTPEADVYKLSKAEQKLYFENQRSSVSKAHEAEQAKITEKASQAEKQIKEELRKSSEASQKEAEDLNRQMKVASRDETLRLRPKIREALSRQSAEYRKLVERGFDEAGEVTSSHKEVGRFIDQRFAGDEALAEAVKERLSLVTRATTDTPVSARQLYEQTKSLGQDISTSAKKGGRTYTPDEKLTDDAISTLVDFVKSKGVDLSEARQFWARYAPIRNELVSKAKPFVSSDTMTSQFDNVLNRVASGKGISEENFVQAVENLLGEKIGTKTREFYEKLDASQKKAVSDKLASEMKIEEARLEKQRASDKAKTTKSEKEQAIADKEFETARQGGYRRAFKNVIKLITAGTIFSTGGKIVP